MNQRIVPQLVLYQPTDAEVMGVTHSAKHRWPTLASRIDKAQDILRDGSLQLEPVAWEKRNTVHWRIASQSHGGAYMLPVLRCPCQDMSAPVLGATSFCKHAIAVASYLKILRNHVNTDIRAREIDLGILPDGTFSAWAKRMGIVHVKRVGSAYSFVDSASAVRYSMYLAAQQPVSVAWPIAQAVAA